MKNSIKRPLISLIMPVYNGQDYLKTCLDSIQSQTFRDFELLIIDNASTDATVQICSEWIENSGINAVYIYTQQKGVSNARNLGLQQAIGTWIAFVDADDAVAETFLEVLYSNAIAYTADLSIVDYLETSDPAASMSADAFIERPAQLLSRQELIRKIFGNSAIGGFVWNKLFKKEILNDIFFDPTIDMCEDTLFLFQVLKRTSSIVWQNSSLYYYYVNTASASHRIENSFNDSGYPRYYVSMNLLLQSYDFSEEEACLIRAGQFASTARLKFEYSQIREKNPLILHNMNRILRESMGDFLKSSRYTVRQKLKRLYLALFWRTAPLIRKVKGKV